MLKQRGSHWQQVEDVYRLTLKENKEYSVQPKERTVSLFLITLKKVSIIMERERCMVERE